MNLRTPKSSIRDRFRNVPFSTYPAKWARGPRKSNKINLTGRKFTRRLYARLGDNEQAIVWLERAYQERDSGLVYLKRDPCYDHKDLSIPVRGASSLASVPKSC